MTASAGRSRWGSTGGAALRGLLVAAAGAAAFGVLLGLVAARWPPLARLNAYAARVLPPMTAAQPADLHTMTALSFIGTDEAHLVMLAPVVGWLLWRRRVGLALWSVVVVVAAAALNGGVKLLAARPRPPAADRLVAASGYGFPSGHADAAVVTYAVLLTVFLPVLARWWRVVVTAVALLIVLSTGFSRVALGVHYVSDVLGGFALGLTWAMLGLVALLMTPARRR